jgi:hypothetical protein
MRLTIASLKPERASPLTKSTSMRSLSLYSVVADGSNESQFL